MKRAVVVMVVMAITLAGILSAVPPAMGQNGPDGVVYVDASAAPGGNGTSWEDAYDTLWEGISGAEDGDEIWVAQGTYYPDEGGPSTDNDPLASFDLLRQRGLYGGFAGFETAREQRDWEANPTVLSGELQQDGNRTNNAYHVTYAGSAGVVLDGFTITGGYAGTGTGWEARGGGMLMIENDGPLTIANCNFYDNYATSGGGIYNEKSVPVLVDCTFEANQGKWGAGMYNNAADPTLTGCSFTGNRVATGSWVGDGGGMYNGQSSPSLENCTFGDNYVEDDGGAMYNDDQSSPVVSGCVFTGNFAEVDGGGMCNDDQSSPEVSGCTFTGNVAGSEGGGMCNSGESSPTLTGCTFTGNLAVSEGGGMSNSDHSNPHVCECTLIGNWANDYGGGMSNYWYANPQVSDCTFTGNWAVGKGGGMSNWDFSNAQVSGCTFESNRANYGGGMYNDASTPWLGNCTFAYNTAGSDGAGLYNGGGSDAALGNCTFYGNAAVRYGGGVYNGRLITVTDCLFQGNLAEVGGGMMCYSDQCSGNVTNCAFWGNRATGDGGALWVGEQSQAVVTNCSFHANSAGTGEFDLGGALYVDSLSVATAVNCIMWGDCPDEIYTEGGASVTYCDVQGDWGAPADLNIDADPMWAHPGAGDFHLLPGSPCIDVGDNAAANLPPFDFEGDNRIIDGDEDTTATVDMGVDEYDPGPPPTPTPTPSPTPTCVEVFYDSFEDGWLANWEQDMQYDWMANAQRATDGVLSAEVDGKATDATLMLRDALDLTGYDQVTLTFWWYIESGIDTGEYVAMDAWNGAAWVEVARLDGNVDTESVWHDETIDLGAYKVPDFKMRFRGKMSLSLEDADVDDVRIVGALP